jgi:hypothetical protein
MTSNIKMNIYQQWPEMPTAPRLLCGAAASPLEWAVDSYTTEVDEEKDLSDRFSQDELVEIIAQYLF